MERVTSTRTIVGKFNIKTYYGMFNIDREQAKKFQLETEGVLATDISKAALNEIMLVGRKINPIGLKEKNYLKSNIGW